MTFFAGAFGLVAGFVSGAIFGMNLFGNYFVHVQFLSSRGYEAGFWIVGIPGGIVGLALGVMIALCIAGRKSGKKT
jgi:hypothetical protein